MQDQNFFHVHVYVVVQFILGLHYISLYFKLIIIHDHTQKQREMKFKPRITLNHNIYIQLYTVPIYQCVMS